MSFRDRMDRAYGRRGGGFSEFPQPPRPKLGPTTILGTPATATEHLSRRRTRVILPCRSELVVSDSLIGTSQ